ncbi:MAG: carcinine hydrolase/isopenicillin-N N-acyltransferase family protein [Dehalococcoidia bacterium]|jgi:hypothetical protein
MPDIQFKESMVLDKQPDTFPIVRYIEARGNQREIGRKLAQLARDRYGIKLARNPSPDFGIAHYAYLKKNYPGLLERARGVMDVYGLKEDDPAIDATVLNYGMMDYGCSMAYFPGKLTENGHVMSVRNMDNGLGSLSEWMGRPRQPGEKDVYQEVYVFKTVPKGGYASLFLSVIDLMGGPADGINEHGLSMYVLTERGAPMNLVKPSGNREVGLSCLQILGLVLETCRNCAEAKVALMTNKVYYVNKGAHYLVGDAQGNSFIFEIDQLDGQAYIEDGNGKTQILTNNTIWKMPPLDKLPATFEDVYDPLNRYRILYQEFNQPGKTKYSETDMSASIEKVFPKKPTGALGGPALELRPLWSVVYDMTSLTMKARFWLKDTAPDSSGNPGLVMSKWYDFSLR